MSTYTGTIQTFYGSWNSGLAHLLVTNDLTGKTEVLLCLNGPTGQALTRLFSSTDPAHIRGERIIYDLDDIGMLSSIGPIEQEV